MLASVLCIAVAFAAAYDPSAAGTILSVLDHRAKSLLFLVMVMGDLSIVLYHWVVPRHPKFTLVHRRAVCLLVHLVGGTLEVACGSIALVTSSKQLQRAAALCTALLCLLMQFPTSLYQLPAMTGLKRLMIPVGILVSVLHACSAARLLADLDSRVHLEQTMVALHWYALSRGLYESLSRIGFPSAMRQHIYTLSIFISGLVVSLDMLGPSKCFASNVLCLATFNALTCRTTVQPSSPSNKLHTSRHLCAARVAHSDSVHYSDAARLVFDELDVDASGTIDYAELVRLLTLWGLPAHEAQAALAAVDKNGDNQISFDEFLDCPCTQAITDFAYKVMRYPVCSNTIFLSLQAGA